MRTIRISAAIFTLGALAACTPAPTLDERLGYLVGRTEGMLVTDMGVPSRTYETEGKRFLQYDQERNIPTSAPSPWVMTPWGLRPAYGGGVYYRPAQCSITFTLVEGRVQAFSYRGDGC
ncbi:hypothetical protein IAI18_02805 [Acetobacteraceae bacterium H6797]|nr:hypothetical protein [Acetobacteraceae bacterium H6797]